MNSFDAVMRINGAERQIPDAFQDEHASDQNRINCLGSFLPSHQLREILDCTMLQAAALSANLSFSTFCSDVAPTPIRAPRRLGITISNALDSYNLVLWAESEAQWMVCPSNVNHGSLHFGKDADLSNASFATTRYESNCPFCFRTADGRPTRVRLIVDPVLGIQYLTPKEEQNLPSNFLAKELEERLAVELVMFKLRARILRPGETVKEQSLSEQGKCDVEMGTLIVQGVECALATVAQSLEPTPLPMGIELATYESVPEESGNYALTIARFWQAILTFSQGRSQIASHS